MASIGFDIFARDRASATLDKVGNSTEKMGHKFSAMKLAAVAGMAGAGVALFKFGQSAIAEARESQKVNAQTAAVIKSTGGAAKVTAAQFGDLATKISNKTGIDDEQIQAGENMLATFTNVRNELGKGNDIFSQATKISTDLAIATGTDQVAANVLLGKALNDPIAGLGKLTKIGVTFSAQQKDQIKAMMKVGDIAGAQKVILAELGKEFGGSAEAQATAGEKAKVAWDNMKETIGTKLLPILDKVMSFIAATVVPGLLSIGSVIGEKLMPYIKTFGYGLTGLIEAFKGNGVTSNGFVGAMERLGVQVRKVADWVQGSLIPALMKMGNWIKDNVIPVLVSAGQWMQKHADIVKYAAVTIGILVVAFETWALITKTVAIAQAALNVVMSANPIALVVIAIAALAAGLIYAYKHSETFRKIVDGAFKAIASGASAMWDVIRPVLHTWIDTFLLVVSTLVHGAATAFGWVPGLGGKLKAAARAIDGFRDDANTALDGIKTPKPVAVKIHDQLTGPLSSIDRQLSAIDGRIVQASINLQVNAKGIPLSAVDRSLGVPARAAGGPVTKGNPYIVGDGGRPELFVPDQNGTILPRVPSSSGGGSANLGMDERALARAFKAALEGTSLRIYGDDGSSRRADLMTRAG